MLAVLAGLAGLSRLSGLGSIFRKIALALFSWLLIPLLGRIPLVSELVFQILGIPVAAKLYLEALGDTVIVQVARRRTLVTRDFGVSLHVFKENGLNYTSRMAEDTGLAKIGMLNNGIIWNNRTAEWRKLRQYFQRSVNNRTLDLATKLTGDSVDFAMDLFPVFRQGSGDFDLLDFLRTVTLDVTNRLMFNVDMKNHAELIEAIVAYFKAWEFFLIRPSFTYPLNPSLYQTHCAAVTRLIHLSEQILREKLEELEEVGEDGVEENFLKQLVVDLHRGEVSRANVVQCILEMLIAGTDTSSVSLFYTLVCLADSPSWEEAVVREVMELEENDTNLPVVEACLKEGMRIKPVGPVVIRRALEADARLDLAAGDNVIISLEEMHNSEERFNQPSKFDPGRFLDGKQSEFLPFGSGPKSCVGQFLAMREMKAVMARLLKDWKIEMQGTEKRGVDALKVRWDIAQQPVDKIYVKVSPRKFSK